MGAVVLHLVLQDERMEGVEAAGAAVVVVAHQTSFLEQIRRQ